MKYSLMFTCPTAIQVMHIETEDGQDLPRRLLEHAMLVMKEPPLDLVEKDRLGFVPRRVPKFYDSPERGLELLDHWLKG